MRGSMLIGVVLGLVLGLGSLMLGGGAAVVYVAGGGDDPLAGLQYVEAPAADSPPMNIPRELREWNWGGGSCVHASTVHTLRWVGEEEFAQFWRKTYAGGESSSGLRSKCDRNNVEYACTLNGDPAFLEWASRSRRGAVIFYYPNHSINFNGYGRAADGSEVAFLLDNNRINEFIVVPKEAFIRAWRGYGGFALTPLARDGRPLWPAPRVPFPAFVEVPH